MPKNTTRQTNPSEKLPDEDSQINPFENLPDELLLLISSHLDVQNLCLLFSTSNQFHRLGKDEPFWKKLVGKYYGSDFFDLAYSSNEIVGKEFWKKAFQKLKDFEVIPNPTQKENILQAIYAGNVTLLKKRLKQITIIDFYRDNIGVGGAIAIAKALETNSSITSIDLWGNKIGDEGAKAIADALKAHSSITSIDLWDNNIGVEGEIAIAKALETNSSITSINFGGNKIGDEGAKAIADALKANSSITSINLRDNNIGVDGAIAIADALKANSSITSIDLWGNKIGDEGAKAIADALKANSSITSIDLWDNNIGVEGEIAIAKALETNSSITSINFGGNKIGDEGAKAIADALKANSSITSINLRDNNIGVDGAIAIADALKANSSITSINLEYNRIGVDGAIAIASKVQNYNFTIIGIHIPRDTTIQEVVNRNKRLAKQYETINNKIKDNLCITLKDFEDDLIFLAIEKNNMTLINILLGLKSKLKDHKTPGDMTLAQFAKVKGRTEIQKMLEERMAAYEKSRKSQENFAFGFFKRSRAQNSDSNPIEQKGTSFHTTPNSQR